MSETKRKHTCFQHGCLGFSRKVSQRKLSKDGKKSRWFSWWKLSIKKSGSKLVPVDTTKPNVKNNRMSSKSKLTIEHVANLKSPPSEAIAAATLISGHITRNKDEENGENQSINQENQRNSDKSKEFPNSKPKAYISHSASFREAKSKAKMRIKSKSNDLDPLVGMTMIVVAMIIIILWGRLYAIFCTSAWLYFVPRLRMIESSNDDKKNEVNSREEDLSSEEYKKRVILEGFLERKHRNTL